MVKDRNDADRRRRQAKARELEEAIHARQSGTDSPKLVLELPGDRPATLMREPGKAPRYWATYQSWSTNEDRKQHFMARQEIKNMWLNGATHAAQQWRQRTRYYGPLPYTVVQIKFYLANARQADPHNYCGTVLKAVVDGLVKAHFWPNDTAMYVGHRESLLTAEMTMPSVRLFFEGDKPWEIRPT